MEYNPLMLIFKASKIVFTQNRGYYWWFLILTILALAFFILAPAWSVPGNDINFQLSLLTANNWILFFVLALFIALLLTMQIFIFRRVQKAITKAKNLGGVVSGIAGAYVGLLSGLFATASCSWCVAALFSFLGAGTIFFIVQNRFWAFLIAINIMFISLYGASKKIINLTLARQKKDEAKNCDC